MDQNEKHNKLVALLKEGGFEYKFIDMPNIDDPILLIKNYAPVEDMRKISFAFPLTKYYDGDKDILGVKCWITCNKVKESLGEMPKPHPDYKNFYYDGIEYFPYSVTLKYTFEEIESIKELCKNLYAHVDFD